VFILLFFPVYSYGQTRQTILWHSFQFPIMLSGKWQMHNDVSYRTIGTSFSAYQYSYRTGLRRLLTHDWSTAAGFAFFFTRVKFDKLNHEFSNEFRLWQEIVKGQMISKRLNVINRLRTEERFLAATSTKDKYFALRFLYKLSFVESLTARWKLQLGDEYMQQLTGNKLGFQQNRLSLTAILVVNAHTQFQTGYMRASLVSATQHNVIFTFSKTITNNEHRHKG